MSETIEGSQEPVVLSKNERQTQYRVWANRLGLSTAQAVEKARLIPASVVRKLKPLEWPR
jgi:hypothetical protein